MPPIPSTQQRYRFLPCSVVARLTALILVLLSAGKVANSQPAATLEEVVEKAVLTNPEVQAAFQTFQSAVEGQKINRGAMLPQLDVRAQIGHEWRSKVPGTPSYDWRRHGYSLQLRQLLFDGFATPNTVKQMGYEKLSSYYDLIATTDNVALEAINAYLDVQRYRQMVQMAQDNFAIHQSTQGLLSSREESGVGRAVDLWQATGRLALAQVNLMTETNNLNDVLQRYQRIVGEAVPPRLAVVPNVSTHLPDTPANFAESLGANPNVLASQATYLASQMARKAAVGRLSPTIELQASTGTDRELPGATYRDVQSSNIQVVVAYNLFRGGSDSARIRQAAADRYAARDVRDNTCRNTQQELAVTWNNIVRLREQLPFLRAHKDSMEHVRVAAEQQFRIGQRSLLDLLDTSNELFDAKRALLNGEYDLMQYEYRWLTLSHRVLTTVGIAQPAPDPTEHASALQLPDSTLALCATPAPDTRNLQPLSVIYSDGVRPPTLVPASSHERPNPPKP